MKKTELPEKMHMFRALLALAGVAFLTMQSSHLSFTPGEGFLLLAATLYATAIVTTSRLSRKGNSLNIGIIQVATIGSWGTFNSLRTGTVTPPASWQQCLMILMLAIVCTGFGFTLQPVAQSRTSSEKAGLFCALGPLVAGILSVLFMKESFTVYDFIGELLILLALIFQYLPVRKLHPNAQKAGA